MYLLNISIHCPIDRYDTVLQTLTGKILPTLKSERGIISAELMEILIEVDPTMRSLALAIKTETLDQGSKTVDRLMNNEFVALTAQCGGREHLLTFTTPMLILA